MSKSFGIGTVLIKLSQSVSNSYQSNQSLGAIITALQWPMQCNCVKLCNHVRNRMNVSNAFLCGQADLSLDGYHGIVANLLLLISLAVILQSRDITDELVSTSGASTVHARTRSNIHTRTVVQANAPTNKNTFTRSLKHVCANTNTHAYRGTKS